MILLIKPCPINRQLRAAVPIGSGVCFFKLCQTVTIFADLAGGFALTSRFLAKMMQGFFKYGLMALICWAPLGVFAQEMARAELEARIEFIQRALESASWHSKLWQRGWMSTMAFNTTVSAFCAFNCHSRNARFDASITAILGANSTLEAYSYPLGSHRWAQELPTWPAKSVEQLRVKLARAEQMLEKSAAREMMERSNRSRIKSYLANVVASTIIAADGRPEDALRSFALVSLAVELKIRTTPTVMSQAKAAYYQGAFKRDFYQLPRFFLSANATGVQLHWRF